MEKTKRNKDTSLKHWSTHGMLERLQLKPIAPISQHSATKKISKRQLCPSNKPYAPTKRENVFCQNSYSCLPESVIHLDAIHQEMCWGLLEILGNLEKTQPWAKPIFLSCGVQGTPDGSRRMVLWWIRDRLFFYIFFWVEFQQIVGPKRNHTAVLLDHLCTDWTRGGLNSASSFESSFSIMRVGARKWRYTMADKKSSCIRLDPCPKCWGKNGNFVTRGFVGRLHTSPYLVKTKLSNVGICSSPMDPVILWLENKDDDDDDDDDDDGEVWSEKPINMIMFMKYNQHNLIFQPKNCYNYIHNSIRDAVVIALCHWHAQRLPLNPLANLVCCFSEGIWIIFHQPERHKKPVKIPMKTPRSMANINQTPRVWFSSSMVAPHFKPKHVVSDRALICSGQINMWKIETWGHEYTTNPASNQANSSKHHLK